jgi:hypothetical protein
VKNDLAAQFLTLAKLSFGTQALLNFELKGNIVSRETQASPFAGL